MSANTQVDALPRDGLSTGERSGLGSQPRVHRNTGVSATLAIMQRELQSIFFSPIAYVVGVIFLVLAGTFFVNETLKPGAIASMRTLFEFLAAVLVFTLPVITMRSVSDEFATGAIESLMTAPLSDASVILGKFFGVMIFYLVLVATTIPHWILLQSYAGPDTASIIWGYVGMGLLGMCFVAVGIFASTCTRHQLLAAILGVSILSLFTFVADYGAEFLGSSQLRQLCSKLSAFSRFSDFTKGMFDLYSVVYLLSGTVFFLFLATKVLESRRWR